MIKVTIAPPTPYQKRRGIRFEIKLVDSPYTGDTARVARRVRTLLEPRARRWQDRVLISRPDLSYEQLEAWIRQQIDLLDLV